MNFYNEMNKTQDLNTRKLTENGAVGHSTTGHYLLDLNFAISSLRNKSAKEIYEMFSKAYDENPVYAMRWLFYARDVRGGVGERRLFRLVMLNLISDKPNLVKALLTLIPEYGRWDDMISLIGINNTLDKAVFKIAHDQLMSDMYNMKENKSISLLAKWLPSINTSSSESVNLAHKFRRNFGMDERTYRKTLSALRKYIDIVEAKMSAQDWNEINYEAVPSRANLIYKDAFLKHDEDRRKVYLDSLKKGEAKINAGTLFPHDIVHKINDSHGWSNSFKYDETAEQLWKNLPDYVKGNGSTLVVADGSGSMCSTIGGTQISAWEVAHALATYFAERASGVFKDNYITFSSRPQFVNLNGTSLMDNMKIAAKHNECADTNIEAVFDLILSTAVRTHCSQKDLPDNILVISDMEFNACVSCNRPGGRYSYTRNLPPTLFDVIADKYRSAGYVMPKLCFWNVNSRTGTIPVTQNEMGVALVSGFSPAVVKMVLSNKTDPYEALIETIMDKRYDPVGKIALNYT